MARISEFDFRNSRGFSFLQNVHIGYGINPVSYRMAGAYSPQVERPGCENKHRPQSGDEVKNEWSYTCVHPYVFIVLDLLKPSGNFTYHQV
jgi:hypothetical protein